MANKTFEVLFPAAFRADHTYPSRVDSQSAKGVCTHAH